MYDKHLMPIVEDLYFTDQTQQVRTMKQDGILKTDSPVTDGVGVDGMDLSYMDKQNDFFKDFILQIENEIMESLGANNIVYGYDEDMIGNQNKKLVKNETKIQIEEEKQGGHISKNDISIMAGLFEEANKEYEEGDEEEEIM
jgi:hypothetical protein